jgi:hypothetical protein
MLIFGMGLYTLFISNTSTHVPSESDRALRGSSLFGLFALKVSSMFRLIFLQSFSSTGDRGACFMRRNRPNSYVSSTCVGLSRGDGAPDSDVVRC